MTRFHLLLVLAFVCGWLSPASLPAQEVRPPFTMNKQYSADMTIVTKNGMTLETKSYIDGDKMRSEMEMNGIKMATIIRRDKSKIYQLMPSQKMVLEMDYDESKFKGQSAAAFGTDGKYELVGPDLADGVNCTKYKVTSDKNHQVFFFWLDTANQVPLKMEAQDNSFTVKWKNFKAGPQSPDLFELPAGYQVMPMPAMPGMPSGMGSGGGDTEGQ